MRRMMGGRGQSSDSDTSTEVDSEQSDSVETAYKKPNNKPVEESIRKKVVETRNILSGVEVNDDLLSLEALGHLHNTHFDETRTEDMEANPEEAVENMQVMSRPEYVKDMTFEDVNEAGKAVVPEGVYNFGKRQFEADTVMARKSRRRKTTRVVRWYEKQPFEDPVLEAKRLRALKAKINHDKNRINLEILRMDARELKDENTVLKEELLKFKQRETELVEKLEDKEATEIRVTELEREVETRKQNEEVLESRLKDLSAPQSVVLVQVWWKFI